MPHRRFRPRSTWARWLVVGASALMVSTSTQVVQAADSGATTSSVHEYDALSASQRANLMAIARQTWKFYSADVDRSTSLPLDNLTYAGGSATPTTYGRYTSAANVGVYLWAVVAAHDLHLITTAQADARVRATLTTVSTLKRYKGFLYQWYDTTTGAVLTNPGEATCAGETTPTNDNCFFISNVDNGWYASGLIEARQALPAVRSLADRLIKPMDFGIFYDGRPETRCNVNSNLAGDPPTGQMYGGYYVGLAPGQGDNEQYYYHNGVLYSDPRISAYIGMGLHQMPGNVWWRTWRELPPAAPAKGCAATDPDNSFQGQYPMAGSWRTYTDPQSGKKFTVWEGHYTYPGTNLHFVPTFAGGMFEGLMADQVVPETSWGPTSFGKADVQTVKVQIKYATQKLGLPVWGMSPSSTPDDTGDYGGYGVEGQQFPYHGTGATASDPNLELSQCVTCATEGIVSPHASFIALDSQPQAAYANIQKLRRLYPGVYGAGGFFDAVDPSTGAVGHRYLVLDQSMIMASLANALEDRSVQRHFAADPVSKMAKAYLGEENMFVR